jgi:hypothetical protein
MNRRGLWYLAMLLLWYAPAWAADPFAHPVTGEALLKGTLSKPAAQLAKAQVVAGSFSHRKHLHGISKPLIATGEFTFARQLGVYWHTRQPFDSVVVLTPSGMLESAEGSQALRLSAEEQPAVRVIANVLLALFSLDLATLEKGFELYAVEEGPRWTIGLKPRSGAMAAVFTQATVSGIADLENVVLTDAQGDRTVIDLTAIEYSNAPPDARTRALFAPAGP